MGDKITAQGLEEWRSRYKAARGMDIKRVARAFSEYYNLSHLKGWEIYELLRGELTIDLLKKINFVSM